MPPQATFYSVAAGTNVLTGPEAEQFMQTEFARVYNLRFQDIEGYDGDIEIYWNGELAYSGPFDDTPGEDFFGVYLIGSGYRDEVEIRAADGSALANPDSLEMIALDYADWSMIPSRTEIGRLIPGNPELPPEVAQAAADSALGITEPGGMPPTDTGGGMSDDPATGAPDDPPTDDTAPPVDDTAPPAEDTTPPADDTTPPADDTTPPADDTMPNEPVADPTGEYLSQTVDTDELAMYSVRFDSPGGFEVYWNGELVSTVTASDETVFTQLYLEGTGGSDLLEIEPLPGAALPDLTYFDLSEVTDEITGDVAALMNAGATVAEDGAMMDDEEDDMMLF